MIRRPLRVAFVDYVLEPDKPGRTGLSDIVWDMASELVDGGHEPHIIASYATRSYPDPRVPVHSFPAPPMGYRNVLGQTWLLTRAAAMVRRIEPDLIHAPEYVSTAVLSTLGMRSPLVLTVPGNIFLKLQTPEGNGYEWHYTQLLKWAARRSARRCARVIAVSQEMKRWWEWTGSRPERTPWIPLGVNHRRIHAVPGARARLGIPSDATLLLYCGRFSREKGLGDLLDALTAIRDVLVENRVQVVLLGKGPLALELSRRVSAARLDRVVEIRPWVPQDEMKIWYSAADALLLPSRSEGFSRTVPEAMICGTPVLGTRITGTEDHVRDGINGFLIPPADPAALAARISMVAREPRLLRGMRAAAERYARAHLTWSRLVDRVVEEVYLPVLDETAA